METQEPNSFEKTEADYPNSSKEPPGSNSSFNVCCCLLLSFLFLSLTLLTAAILLILFALKPKKPVFHLHSVQLDSFKLEVAPSTKHICVSPSMASLLFVTQNPNKLGIRYSTSELGVLYENIPVGAVEVPTFYQPAHSRNVTVIMHVSVQRFDISRLVNASHVEVQIQGGIGVQTRVLNFPLPRIKVSLDCRISLNYGIATLSKGVDFIKRHKALLLSNFPHLSQKCSLSLI